MSKSQKKRYLLAVYAVVTAIAVVIAFFAFTRNSDTWQSLLLNLATELLGVVLVFSLVNAVFLLDEWDLSEQVKELIQKIKEPSAKDFFRPPPDQETLQQYLQGARSIDLLGVTLTVTLNRNISNLRDRLSNGVDIRIIIIYPSEEILKAAAERSESGDTEYFRQRLHATLNDIKFLHSTWESFKGSNPQHTGDLSIGLLPYTPSFGILHFYSGTREGVMTVEMYPHHTGYDLQPYFALTQDKDGYWYNYFSNQFEEMWKRTTPWQPAMKTDSLKSVEYAG